jgi:formamidopyrimidine-DNA glycosylase
MPELPEVETMRRGIAPVVGSRIDDVRRPRCRFRAIQIRPRFGNLRRRVLGRQIVDVDRIGKRVLLRMDSEDRVVFEPRMSGRLLLCEPPDTEHLRVVFELSGGKAKQLLFWSQRGLSTMELLGPAAIARRLGTDRLGPDALSVTSEELHERLGRSRRAIKVALLDQAAVAGIGNIYAAEILHRARLHPQLPCRRLRRRDWTRLQACILEVLEEAVARQGSTLADGTYRDPLDRSGSFQEQLRVYQRAGEPCLQCGAKEIARIVQAQRSTFFCPKCQTGRGV